MPSRTVLIDIDGVVLDLVRGLYEWVVARGLKPRVTLGEINVYDMSQLFPGLPEQEVAAEVRKFIGSPHFAVLPSVKGAREGLARIRREVDGATIIALTACGTEPSVRRARQENLEGYGIDRIRFVPYGSSKLDELLTFQKGALLIDDLPSNLASGVQSGHEVLLFDAPYNRDSVLYQRAMDWEKVAERAIARATRPNCATPPTPRF